MNMVGQADLNALKTAKVHVKMESRRGVREGYEFCYTGCGREGFIDKRMFHQRLVLCTEDTEKLR